jgi:hypothetical protein
VPIIDEDMIEYAYFQCLLLLFRPVLGGEWVEDDLLLFCASLSADACEVQDLSAS